MKINEKTWTFIKKHADEDVRKVALLGVKDPEVDLQMALQQIAGRQTACKKLPSWAAIEGIIYPPHLNMEQCSSEQTARYKGSLTPSPSPKGEGSSMFVDLTGGFGIDFYWMSQGFAHRYYVEQNEQLCGIAENNFRLLGLDSSVCCCDTATYLTTMPHVSLAYLDPARRNEHGGRTYGIADCSPNVLELLPVLMEKADQVILKLSPMLDWRKAVADINALFPVVHEVHIVSVDNECKELVILLRNEIATPYSQREKEETKNEPCQTKVVCVNLLSNGERQVFAFGGLSPSTTHTGDNLLQACPHFLYEPNASIMKAGCFIELGQRYAVTQISPNSHLFLSSVEIDDFPGRRFQIVAISSMNKKELSKNLVSMERANIAVRNFPMSVEQLRKKLKLKDGGDTYIFATTDEDGEHKLFICRKIG